MTDTIITFSVKDALVAESDVLQAQGMPADFIATGQLKKALDTAREQFLQSVDPVAVCSSIDIPTFTRLFIDKQNEWDEIPTDIIIPKASRLVLFVLTLGPQIDTAIEKLFADHDYTAGLFLDTYASLGVSRLIIKLESMNAQPGESVLAYCPGYCGWAINAMHEILQRTNAGRIGVTLNDSFLMSPLKSAGGALVAGTRFAHQFDNHYPFCADCKSKTCRQRLASLKGNP